MKTLIEFLKVLAEKVGGIKVNMPLWIVMGAFIIGLILGKML